jgi:hypothetical protein
MALDWIPTYPDRVPHHRVQPPSGSDTPFTAAVIPPVQAPGFLSWSPTFPDQVPHRRSTAAQTQVVEPLFLASLWPLAWWPQFPDAVPHQRIPAAALSGETCPPAGDLIRVAESLAWAPTYPDQVPHQRVPTPSGSILAIDPGTVAAGSSKVCVDLVRDQVTQPAILSEQVTPSDLVQEMLTQTDMRQEGIC